MSAKKPTYEELKKKLAKTEALVTKLQKIESKAKKKPDKTKEQRDKVKNKSHALLDTKEYLEAYKASEQNFKNSIDASPLGVRIVTADGDLIYANQAILDICGYKTAQELAAVPRSKLYTPESYQAHQERKKKRRLKEYTPSEYEISIQRPDGEVRNLQVFRREVTWGGEQQFMALYQDITERKQAEVALRESEARFHTIVERGNDGIVFIQNRLIQYCNSKMLEMVDYTEAEAIGKSFLDFIAPEYKKMVADTYRKRIAGEKVPERYEANLVAKSGRTIYVEISASLVNYKQETVDIAIVRDISARKQAEETLENEATRRRILVEQSRDGIVVLDQDGNVFESNQKFADMLGYTMEEMKQLHVFDWEFLYPKERVVEMIRTVDEKGDHFETQHRRKDGTIYDVEISTNGAMFGEQKLIFCVCRDISERKQMEQVIRESEEKFSKAFNSSPEMMVIVNIDEDRYIEVNDSFADCLGYSREELIGHQADEFNLWVYPEEKERMNRLMQEQGKISDEEFRFRTKNGEIRTWLCSADTLDIGGIRCMLGTSTDITERKRAQEALRESQERFSRAFHVSPAIVVITTLKDGRFVEVNDTYLQITGNTREEVIGKTSTSMHAWADPKDRIRMFRILQEKGRIDKEEFDFHMKSGEIRTWLFSAEPITLGGEECLIAVSVDITERKRGEEELAREREDIKLIMDTSRALIWYKDVNGKFLRVNRAFAEAMDTPEKDIVGKTVFDLYSKDIAQSMTNDDREVLVSGSPKLSIVEQYESAAGLRWVQTDKVPVLDKKGNPLGTIGFAQDITERKRTEEAIKESEERFRTLFETMAQGVIYRDSEGKIISVNPAAQSILGMKLDDILGKTSQEMGLKRLHEDGSDFPSEEQPSSVALRTGKPVNNVIMAVYNPVEKAYRWTLNNAIPEFREGETKPYRVYTTFTDITGRKQGEQRINYLNQTLRSIRNINQLITREKDPDTLLQSVCDTLVESRSFYMAWIALFDESRRLTKFAYSGMPGDFSPIAETIKQGNLPSCVEKALKKNQVIIVEDPASCTGCQMFEKSLDYGSMSVRLEYDDNIYGVLCASLPKEILADKDEVSLFQEIANDISFALYNLALQSEYERMEEERLRADKLESIGTLAGGIAHDFNNLLTGIMGNIGMVKANTKPTETTYEMLEEAEKATTRARDLTQQLLTFARGGKPVKKPVQIAEIIKESATFALRGSKAKLQMSLPDNLWPIEADEGQISQVINNLVINADEAMPEGGRLKIQVANVTLRKKATQLLPSGNYVRIDIADTGIGIGAEYLSKIFEPYFTTKKRGSGLGLTTAYSIVRNHGGIILADSTPNKGSTFHVYLPATKKPLAKGGKKMTAEIAGQAGGKILVMDDEEIIRKMLKNMLNLAGYTVELSADGAEALKKYQEARKAGDLFSAVIMDLTIPGGMGGKEAVQKLLEIDPNATVIVSSGYANDPIMSDYKSYGFKAVIAKPYSAKQLQATLSGLLTRKKR